MTNNIIMKEMPEASRPYEKCLKSGPGSLSDEELLAVIIRTGTRGENSRALAARILNSKFGEKGLTSIMHWSVGELTRIKGVGNVKAVQIQCIGELSKRIAMASREKLLDFQKPETIADYYMEKFRHLETEQTVVIFLDTKCRKICDKILFTGTVNKSMMSPREIFIEALRCCAVNIILLHNHPSGDVTPSRDDINSTKRMIDAGRVIGINLLDHIIIGDKKFISLRQAGFII